MSTKLSVNLNAVAQLRNRREVPWPSVTGIGRIALEAGAIGLTVHPRPDQRHIRFSDIPELAELIRTEFPDREFNIEGYPTDAFIELVLNANPTQATLVPDDPAQSTSDHGWDFKANHNMLKEVTGQLKEQKIRVALFSDPDVEQVSWATDTGCDRLELYTGPYGATFDDPEQAITEIEKLAATAERALTDGLMLNAGHDLTVENLPPLLTRIPEIAEVSIGHGLTADALIYGMEHSVKRFIKACNP